MRQEVKQVALRQLAEGGPGALSLNAIAKDLGVSGPALYRCFAGRDALLTELILDAYADLTAAISAARRPPGARLGVALEGGGQRRGGRMRPAQLRDASPWSQEWRRSGGPPRRDRTGRAAVRELIRSGDIIRAGA